MKPVTYCRDRARKPDTSRAGARPTGGRPGQGRPSDGKPPSGKEMSLRDALAHSRNTVTAISGCRSAAIVVQGPDAEELVAIVETKNLGQTEAEIGERLAQIENSVHSAISESHGIVARELVLVSRGAIPLTTSGKIRRQACVERYASGTFERVR